MKTILLAVLAAFALSHNVMADDTAAPDATMTKESTKTEDNGDGTQTTTHKHMKKGHGKMHVKKTQKTEDAPASDDTTK